MPNFPISRPSYKQSCLESLILGADLHFGDKPPENQGRLAGQRLALRLLGRDAGTLLTTTLPDPDQHRAALHRAHPDLHRAILPAREPSLADLQRQARESQGELVQTNARRKTPRTRAALPQLVQGTRQDHGPVDREPPIRAQQEG